MNADELKRKHVIVPIYDEHPLEQRGYECLICAGVGATAETVKHGDLRTCVLS